MAVITISRGSYSHGKSIAEEVARRLGYECVAREVLLEASDEFNIDEVKLVRALHDAPSILERFTMGREKYVSYIQDALLRHMRKDNVVYHGLAGHFFVAGVSHVLKVRIIADMENRIMLEMERNSVSKEEASHLLVNDDEERRKWSNNLYGIDTRDASLYDLVVHIRKIQVDDAVEIICNTVQLEQFQTTPESQQVMDDLALAAEVKSQLVDSYPTSTVTVRNGAATIRVLTSVVNENEVAADITAIVSQVEGVSEVSVDAVPSTAYA
jgi:cytidylate kinase